MDWHPTWRLLRRTIALCENYFVGDIFVQAENEHDVECRGCYYNTIVENNM